MNASLDELRGYVLAHTKEGRHARLFMIETPMGFHLSFEERTLESSRGPPRLFRTSDALVSFINKNVCNPGNHTVLVSFFLWGSGW